MSDEFVTMYHAGTGNVSEQVSRQAFDDVWSDKGWALLEPGEDLQGLSKDKLTDIATERGVDISQAKTKADIVTALKGASNG